MTLLGCPDLASRRWIWEQYDHSVMANTIQKPGGDAAVVRVGTSTKALAISTDVTPRYCKANPFEGGKQAVAEAWRNLTAVGAQPLAITDCLNFGNPNGPILWVSLQDALKAWPPRATRSSFPSFREMCRSTTKQGGEAIPRRRPSAD